MTTFHTRILQCPFCEGNMYTFELTSYTVNSTVVYSDGKTDCNPPVMHDKNILICHYCNKEFWREDAVLLDECVDCDDLPNVKDVYDLAIDLDPDFSFKLAEHYNKMLEQGFANTTDKEVYLRIEIWHLLNDETRYNKKSKSKQKKQTDITLHSSLFISNLKKLINIFIPENDGERLLLAEMYRELGDFQKALSVLDEIEYSDNPIINNAIKKAAKRKISKVIKINQN